MDEFNYNDSVACSRKREVIQSAQLPIEELQSLVHKRANERAFQKVIKDDLSFLADVFASSPDEFICLSEYPIGDRIVDYVVLTSRSRMEVYLIEVKGANFRTSKETHYGGMNNHIHDAVKQLTNHKIYIDQHYNDFRKQIHSTKASVVVGTYLGNCLLGPKGNLFVDQDKDIILRFVAIGGTEGDGRRNSHECTVFENSHQNLSVYSWESFLRRVDPNHGHYFAARDTYTNKNGDF